MRYLSSEDILEIGVNWKETVAVIEETVKSLNNNDCSQPLKPYLRYGDAKNRIIAMPAYVGGKTNYSGIKWVASFPDNINHGLPRAHSVVILNEAATGKPVCIINSSLISIIRTASVSGLMMSKFKENKDIHNAKLGIIGWGPIGQYHLKMADSLFGEDFSKVSLYDLREINNKYESDNFDVEVVDKWEDAYNDADVFMTCTASDAPYIDGKPKDGALLLNVSLRDFKTSTYDYVKDGIIVDDWTEVCREKTDIEFLHLEKGLQKEDTKSIIDVVCNNCMKDYDDLQPVMFNPMGMSIFDIAIAGYYLDKALKLNIGKDME